MERLDSTPVINNFLPVRKPMELSRGKTRQNCRMRALLVWLAALTSGLCCAAPGYSVWGDFKYQPGFTHFDYVNPAAPKGGELRLVAGSRVSNFDKYNPFTLKGRAPSFLPELLFESLLTGSMDEVSTAYGLLAD